MEFHECPDCDRKFPTEGALNGHQAVHSDKNKIEDDE